MKTMLAVVCALLMAGCQTEDTFIVAEQDIGIVLSVELSDKPFGKTPQSTIVTCDSFTVVLGGQRLIRLHHRMYLCTDAHGREWFRMEGSNDLWPGMRGRRWE